MLEGLIAQCKEHKESFETSRFCLLQENYYQHTDFLVVGWLIHLLNRNQEVTFIAFRENYAHYLALSKKMGTSIEGFLKTKQLKYIECFQGEYCSELPLTETSPACYISPPSFVQSLLSSDLMNRKSDLANGGSILVDAISFVDDRIDLCFWLYEQAALQNKRLILGGSLERSELNNILELEADLVLTLENDVGGYGKLRVKGQGWVSNVMWKTLQGKIQFTQHINI